MTFGSLFSGIGGLDLGLERAGMECRWQCEIDPYCRQVLAKHWPNIPCYEDVRTIGENLERVNWIVGGFPCQDVSSAGHRAGIEEGTRSGLWLEILRVIRILRPDGVLLENVSALLNRIGGTRPAPISRVLGDLAASGFDAEWDCFPTGFNSGHRRERTFIVAYPMRSGLSRDRECGATTYAPKCLYVNSATPSFLRADAPPQLVRNVHGIPRRMDRIKALGNAVYPAAAEWIGRRIMGAA